MKSSRSLSWALLALLFIPFFAEAATLTLGTAVSFGSSIGFQGAAKLDSTHVLVAYGASSTGLAAIATVDGTDVTFGSTYQFNGANTYSINAATLDSTHAVIVYETGGTSYAVVATVSGSTISYGSPATISTSMRTGSQVMSVAALDSTHIAVVYVTQAGTFSTKVVVASISGTTITFGSATTLSANSGQYVSIAAMDSTHFVAGYNLAAGTPYIVAGSVSDTTITLGSAVTFSGYSSDPSISKLDATHALVGYRSTTGDNSYAFVATLSDVTLSAGTSQAINAVSAYYPLVIATDASHGVVLYRNNADGGFLTYAAQLTIASGTVTADTASAVLPNISNLSRAGAALDSSSALLIASNQAIVVTTDTTAPSAPSSFAASATSSTINLSWTNPVDSDFLSTTIRRSASAYPTSHTNGTAVSSGVTGTSTSQTSLVDGVYYYSIFARDLRGNYSTVAQATATVDTTPPAAPSSFAVSVAGSTAALTWTNPVDSDFSSVTIRRSTSTYPTSVSEGTLVVQNETGTSYNNTSLSDGTYYYSIFAKDTSTNYSGAANATATVSTAASSSSAAPQQSTGGGRGGGGGTAAIVRALQQRTTGTSAAHPAAPATAAIGSPAAPSASAATAPTAQPVLASVRMRLEERVRQQIAANPRVAPILKKMLARMEARMAKFSARVSRK